MRTLSDEEAEGHVQNIRTTGFSIMEDASVLRDGFLLSTMGTAVVGTGEPAQDLHVDDGVYTATAPCGSRRT